MIATELSSRASRINGHPGVPLDEAQAEVDCTAHAVWMHAMDCSALSKKWPLLFQGDAEDDIRSAHRRLTEIIRIMDARSNA